MAKKELPQITLEDTVLDRWNAIRAERKLTHAEMVGLAVDLLGAGEANELEALRRQLDLVQTQLAAAQRELSARAEERRSEFLDMDIPFTTVWSALAAYTRLPEFILWEAGGPLQAGKLAYLESHGVLLRTAHHRLLEFRAKPTASNALALHVIIRDHLRPMLQSEIGGCGEIPYLTNLTEKESNQLLMEAIRLNEEWRLELLRRGEEVEAEVQTAMDPVLPDDAGGTVESEDRPSPPTAQEPPAAHGSGGQGWSAVPPGHRW